MDAALTNHHEGSGRVGEVVRLEPWLDKKALAEYLGCGERWIEYRMDEGMPHARIAGRIKFRATEVEPWLERHGYMERVNCA